MPRRTLFVLALFAIACDSDGDGFANDDDCAPNDADIYPRAAEVCDGIDNNCDGSIDENVTSTFYADGDGDGYGNAEVSIEACEAPAGFLTDQSDCDDVHASANPGAQEICDDIDNDCDTLVDSDDDTVDASTGRTFYRDLDEDGYGDDLYVVTDCSTPEGYVDQGGDCDDVDASLNPDTQWYSDQDLDGYGSADHYTVSCTQPDGYIADDQDCDDANALVNPEAQEVCDGDVDNDCDGLFDDSDPKVDTTTFSSWYLDTDGDGYGETAVSVVQCKAPSGYVAADNDCDETDTNVNPSMDEVCLDGIDNNCDGGAPECGLDEGTYDPEDAHILLSGSQTYEYFGRQVATADINGDGAVDLAVASYGYDGSEGSTQGKVSVFLGPVTSARSPDLVIEGGRSSDYFGYSLESAGDVDGDGNDDMVVGGYYSGSRGRGWLFYGATSVASGTWSSGDLASSIWDADNSSDYFGYSSEGYGDLDDDGYDDFGFGAYYQDSGGTSSGSVYIWYGGSDRIEEVGSAGDADLQIYGSSSSSYVGYINSHDGGDLDGDGLTDLVIGEYYGSGNGYYGAAHVVYGTGTALVGSYKTTDAGDARLLGPVTYSYFGETIQIRDLDGDGYEELIVGTRYGASDKGEVYYFRGSAAPMSGDYSATNDAAGSFEGETTYDYFGRSVAAGDINGDGDEDLGIGAYGNDTNGSSAGATYVFFGPFTGGTVAAGNATSLIYGKVSGDYCGYDDVDIADIGGDGVQDLIGNCYYGNNDLGQVFIFNGGSM